MEWIKEFVSTSLVVVFIFGAAAGGLYSMFRWLAIYWDKQHEKEVAAITESQQGSLEARREEIEEEARKFRQTEEGEWERMIEQDAGPKNGDGGGGEITRG